MGEIFKFIKINCSYLWRSPRLYIVLFAVYVGLKLCFGDAVTHLISTKQTVQAVEFFVFATTNRISQWILVFGLLLLIGDIPFLHDGIELYAMRSSRKCWLAGQLLFFFLSTLIYLFLVACMFLFMFRGYISFANTWSDPIILSCQIGSGALLNIKMMITFPMQIISGGSPYKIFVLSYIYSTLFLYLCSLICLACNMKYKSVFGFFFITVLLVWRIFLEKLGNQNFLCYLSPSNLASIGDRTLTEFNIYYTVLFFVFVCGLLCALSYNLLQKTDIQRKYN